MSVRVAIMNNVCVAQKVDKKYLKKLDLIYFELLHS